MSYNELSQRELQTMCKEYGLPANKTNVAMASSLRTFLGDPKTNVLARAPQVLALAEAKKSIRARVQPKSETKEMSVAAILLSAKPWDLVSNGKLSKKGRDLSCRKNIKADLSAFIVLAPSKKAADNMLPKTALPLRTSRIQDASPSTNVDEISSFGDFAQEDSAETTNTRGKGTFTQASGTVTKSSTTEVKIELDLNAAALVTCNEGIDLPYQQDAGLADFNPGIQVKIERQTSPDEFKPVAKSSACDQGHQTKTGRQKYVQPALSPLFRITANVDKLINRATAMLEKFQEWKSDLPPGPAIDVAIAT